MVIVLVLAACGGETTNGSVESTTSIAPGDDIADAVDSGAESCAAEPGTLGGRAFAFDGTVTATSEQVDPTARHVGCDGT